MPINSTASSPSSSSQTEAGLPETAQGAAGAGVDASGAPATQKRTPFPLISTRWRKPSADERIALTRTAGLHPAFAPEVDQ